VKKSITDMNYTLPSAFGVRAPSFGIGDRFGDKHDRSGKNIINCFLLNIVENPSPDSYRLGSAFEFNPEASFSKSKAYTFGVSRAAYDKVYIPS
jgi:hypothetical protein